MGLAWQEVTAEEGYNPLALSAQAPLTQSWLYGQWQLAISHSTKRFVQDQAGTVVASAQAVQFPLPAGRHYWYIPYGPVVKNLTEATLDTMQSLVEQLADKQTVFVRFDFSPVDQPSHALAVAKPWRSSKSEAASSLQPRAEWMVDITQSEEQLLKQMQYDGRRSIRLSLANKQLEFKIVTTNLMERFADFMQLQTQTAQRNQFNLHSSSYYEAIFRTSEQARSGFLIEARYEGMLIAAGFIVLFGKVATYLLAGSDETYGKLFAAYGLQWLAIKEARERGAILYNFGGITSDTYPRASLRGPTIFKQKFGGQELLHPHLYDYVVKPSWYNAYQTYKRLQGMRQ